MIHRLTSCIVYVFYGDQLAPSEALPRYTKACAQLAVLGPPEVFDVGQS